MKNLKNIKANWKMIGIAVAGAATLYYPALKLYQLLTKKKKSAEDAEKHMVKMFSPAYRGKHKPHHRKAPEDPGLGHS
jgi:hypothetical protein